MKGLLAGLALVGCRSNDGIDFPAVLGPLEDNLAPAPPGEGFPQTMSIVSGGDDDLWWAHGHAYVHASVGVTWIHARDIDVCVDRREVEEWTVTSGVVAEFDASYTIHNIVNDVIRVEYDTTWVHEVQGGTVAQPETVVAQWDKTAGTTFIDLLAGSLVLQPVEDQPEVTEVLMVAHLKAALRDDQTMVTYLTDYYADLLASLNDEPLPSF